MSSLTISDLLKKQREFDEKHIGDLPFFTSIDETNLEDLEHLVVCMLGELGEFANVLKKVRRGDFPLSIAKAKLDEELVDVFVYLLKICGQFDVDLEAGYIQKMEKNTKKFKKYER